MSLAEQTLAAQLDQAGIPYEREYLVSAPGFLTPTGRRKKWRADFRVKTHPPLLIEVEGGVGGTSRHTTYTGFTEDCVKYAAAAILGFRLIRATSKQVDDGDCYRWIRAALGLAA